jgi:hypothetical protein
VERRIHDLGVSLAFAAGDVENELFELGIA